MASSGRTYHQDYIARIRYSNSLPPPPNPPKLLDIPNTGLSGGLYTSAGFSSRLAREQPLNIEADAELGMPIDLIGLPGVFDGDESAISALENPPVPHPSDRPLLRPLATLGKPSSTANAVSFLRRTEYISSAQGGLRFDSSTSKDLVKARPAQQRRRRRVEKDDPLSILRGIIKGFDIAHPRDAFKGPDGGDNVRGAEPTPAEQEAWARPKHPKRPGLTLLDAYPVLPDLDALPDEGFYAVAKFSTNPVASSSSASAKRGAGYDPRLDVSLLRVLADGPAEYDARHEAARAAREADPNAPAPQIMYDYEFFLPSTSHPATSVANNGGSIRGIKRKFDPLDAAAQRGEEDAHYNYAEQATGRRFFRYDRVRAYETTQQTGDAADWFCDAVAVALHDGPEHEPRRGGQQANGTATEGEDLDGDDEDGRAGKRRRLQKAAYVYPIAQRTFIRPRRGHNVKPGQAAPDEEDKVDVLELVVRDRNDEEEEKRRGTLRKEFNAEVDV